MGKKKIYALRIKYKGGGNAVVPYESKIKRDLAKPKLKKDRTIEEIVDVEIHEEE